MIYPIPKYVRPEARRQESLMHINSPFGTRPIVLEVNVRTYVGSLLVWRYQFIKFMRFPCIIIIRCTKDSSWRYDVWSEYWKSHSSSANPPLSFSDSKNGKKVSVNSKLIRIERISKSSCVAISIHKIHEVSMHHHHSMHKRFQLAIRCVIRILEIPLLLRRSSSFFLPFTLAHSGSNLHH